MLQESDIRAIPDERPEGASARFTNTLRPEAIRKSVPKQRKPLSRKARKRILLGVGIVLLAAGTGGYWYANNTVDKLLERGWTKYDAGEEQEGIKLFIRAFEKDQTGQAAVNLYDVYRRQDSIQLAMYYCRQAADAGWEEHAFLYGLFLEERGENGISYLKKGFDSVDDAEYALEVGRAAYFLGNEAYRTGRTGEAKQYWKRSSEMGCPEGRMALGDWYLCHGEIWRGYREALACYEEVYMDISGIDERIKILRDLKRHSSWSAWSYSNGDVLRAEDINGWEGKTIKRGVYSWKDGGRLYGKFDAHGNGVNAPGVITYKQPNGAYALYVGDLRFIDNSWVRYGKGTYIGPDRTFRTGRWVNDEPAEKNQMIRPAERPWEP